MQGIQTNLHTLPPPPAYRGMTAPASGLQYAAKTAQEWVRLNKRQKSFIGF